MRGAYTRMLELKGVRVGEAVRYWQGQRPALERARARVARSGVRYPSYFTTSIHTYEGGHLSWEQAYESTCHMQMSAMLCDVEMKECTPEETYAAYRRHIVENVKDHLGPGMRRVVDLGCGTGQVTKMLSNEYDEVVGVDLSPPYLSVASLRFPDLQLVHANAEGTGMVGGGFDGCTLLYVLHEMPAEAISNTLREAYRLLKEDGGRLVVIDMDPEALPAHPSFIDLSEPHLRAYRAVSMMDEMHKAGFRVVHRRHLHNMSSMWIGIK